MIVDVVAVDPTLDEILVFCAEDPIERVFLEDIARRGLGRFSAFATRAGCRRSVTVGRERRSVRRHCGAFAGAVVRGQPRMIIGQEQAVDELWADAASAMPAAA